MLKKGLSYLIVMLIAMQSVVAIAETVQSHHSDDQHENHQHSIDTNLVDEHLLDIDLANSDCHHCCHSHVMAHFSLTTTLLSVAYFDHQLPDGYDSYRSHLLFPDIRPPIV